MTRFEVIAYSHHGFYSETVEASTREDALKLAKRSMKTWLPKGVQILKWVVRNY